MGMKDNKEMTIKETICSEANGDMQMIRTISRENSDYPVKLRGIPAQPSGLWLLGSLPPTGMPSVAIVGARRATPHGKWMAEKLAYELSRKGMCIVSGMAEGIDGAAHRGALEANGVTLAVLGCGVDICYPKCNMALYDAIRIHGGILSEYPPGTLAQPFTFPARNRIISGMADLVIVVEAREKSGSLITVSHALSQGRDVMAVPGRPDDPCSEACNRLIKEGAGCCTCADDVLRYLEVLPPPMPRRGEEVSESVTLEENLILSHLTGEPCHVDTLAEKCGIPASSLAVMLVGMELKGLVTAVTSGLYRRG